MKKILNRVTLTGADESVHPRELYELHKKYPFVEWGILLSETSAGKRSRFPSDNWIGQLNGVQFMAALDRNPMQLSGHICGKWVREILEGGDYEFIQNRIGCFKRYQLNTHGEHHKIADIEAITGKTDCQVIVQYDNVNTELLTKLKTAGYDAAALFDLSHGAGVLPEEWPSNLKDTYCGYAGGLSPENVADQLIKIETMCGKDPIWIDAETHLRANETHFYLDACERFLKACEPWVIKE